MSLVLFGACNRGGVARTAPADSRNPPAEATAEDRGSPHEVLTTKAVIDGIDLVVPCSQPGDVGVVGHGRESAPPVEGDGSAYNRWASEIADRTHAALGKRVLGVGWGVGCRDDEVGPRVYVARYADVDATVVGVVAFAREHDLNLSFLVTVAHDVQRL